VAEHRQSIVKVPSIDEHLTEPAQNRWYVVGYDIMCDSQRNVEEFSFIWRRD